MIKLKDEIKQIEVDMEEAKLLHQNRDLEVKKIVEDSHEMIENCRHTSMMLLNLTNDLMDLAKQEKLTFQLHKSYFSLIKTVKNSIQTLDFLSQKKNIGPRCKKVI